MQLESLYDLAIPALGFLLLMCLGVLIGTITIVRQEMQFTKKMKDELKNYNP